MCVALPVTLTLGCASLGPGVTKVDPSKSPARIEPLEGGTARAEVAQPAVDCCPTGYWGAACEFCEPGVADRSCTRTAFIAERLQTDDESIWLGTDNRVFQDPVLGSQTDPDGMVMTGIRMRIERVVQGDLADGHVQIDSEGRTTVFWQAGGTLASEEGLTFSLGGGPAIPPRGFFRVSPLHPDETSAAIGWFVTEVRETLHERCPKADTL